MTSSSISILLGSALSPSISNGDVPLMILLNGHVPVMWTVSGRYPFVVNQMKAFQYHLKSVARKHFPEPARGLASPSTPVFSNRIFLDKAHI